MAPRLLIVATTSRTIEGFLVPFARHFRSLGWRVEAAAHGATTEALMAGGFDAAYDLPLSRSLLDVSRNVKSVIAVRRLLEATRPDIVHVHTPIAGFVTRLAARQMPEVRRPYVVYTAHGFHFSKGGNRAMNAAFLLAERVAGRWTDRLVVINQEDREAAQRRRIVPPRRLVYMPGIGIDTAHFSRSAIPPDAISGARSRLGVPAGAPLVIMVAELSRRKRPGDMIRAFAAMHDRRAHLLFAGPGPLRHGVEAQAAELGVSDRVHFSGFALDVRPLVANSTVLVLPSSREGLARSVMEALALEVPVIVSTARGNEEIVGDEAGIVTPIGDVPALARALDWVVAHPDESAAMGRRGRQRVQRLFELEIVLRMHDAMYAELLGARP